MFDNPPAVSDDPNVQMQRAWQWHVDWGWTQKDACEKSGCSEYRLRKAVQLGGPDKVPAPGRKTLFGEAIIAAVLTRLENAAVRIETVSLERGNPNSVYAIIMEEIRKAQPNPLAEIQQPAWKTQKEWAVTLMQRGCAARVGEVKAKGRKKPFLNLRNGVAYAGTIRALFVHRFVHPEMLISIDDVSHLVHATMSDARWRSSRGRPRRPSRKQSVLDTVHVVLILDYMPSHPTYIL